MGVWGDRRPADLLEGRPVPVGGTELILEDGELYLCREIPARSTSRSDPSREVVRSLLWQPIQQAFLVASR